MELVPSLLVLAIVVAAFWFMLRPVLRGLFGTATGKERKATSWQSGANEIALEVAMLVSLLLNIPAGLFGFGAIPAVVAMALGLAFLPIVARPAIAGMILVLSVTRLEPAMLAQLLLVLVAFIALRLVLRFFGGGLFGGR